MRTLSPLRPRTGQVFVLGNWRWIVFFLIWGLCLGVVISGRPDSPLWYLAILYLGAALFVTARKFYRTRAELLFLREFHHLSQTLDDIRALEVGNPFDPILALVTRLVGFDRAVLLLPERTDGQLRPVRSYGVPEATLALLPAVAPAEALVWRSLQRGEILLIDPTDPALAADPPLRELAAGSLTICLPIQRRQQNLGVLLLFHGDAEVPLSDDVLLQLQILIDQIGISLHNLTLHQDLREKAQELELRDARMNKELELARLVQDGVLPWTSPTWPGMTISAFFRPARFIGGDYYSYLDGCSHNRRDCVSKS
ncbi:MAG TPA: GAF domain-containing protein, partial [Candidatus Ozemobacteraceae bacterium]|nr:GAF domain-containing protein [Candidatus Ozemobacteraceae bacterium]